MPENQTPPAGGEMYRAGLPTLGARLLAAAGLVRPGAAVADVGCDHGKLAVYLALQDTTRRVVATDLNPLPLARARALVRQTGCGARVECRLGDGLAPLEPGEAQDIVIAGMSGETMAEILAAATWIRAHGTRLVLVPTTRQSLLRGWLWAAGFAILREQPVREAGRVYSVLCAEYTGEVKMPTPLELELGLLRGQGGEAVAQYITNRLCDLRNRLQAPLAEEERAGLEALIQEVEACLP